MDSRSWELCGAWTAHGACPSRYLIDFVSNVIRQAKDAFVE